MRIFLVFGLLLAGCNYNHVKQSADDSDALTAANFEAPDYNTVQAAVIGPRCLNCHSNARGNQGNTNLEGYDHVRALLNRIVYRTLEKRDMPPGAPLGGQAALLLQNWLDMGAPQTVVAVGEKPDPELSKGPNDWAKVRDRIFLKKCNDCHSGPSALAGLDVTDLKQVRAKAPLIFNRVIVVGDMPMAPYTAMTPRERKVLLGWFDSGMPE